MSLYTSAVTRRFVFVLCLPVWFASAEEAVPDFAFGRIDIAHIGQFQDRIGNFANYVIPNASYLAKTVVANSLFRVPIDASIQSDGPARLFLIEPVNPGPSQESASILPVRNADAFKRNLVAVYGPPAEKDGAWAFAVPQPLPEPDHFLVVKLIGDRAYIAPTLAILNRLEQLNTPQNLGEFDAELTLSVAAFKRLYAKQIESALQAGAAAAAENMEALRTVSSQLDELQKTIWELQTVSLHVGFDPGSTQVTLELAAKTQPLSELAAALGNYHGVTGKEVPLLPPESILALNLNVDGKMLSEIARSHFKTGPEDPTAKALGATFALLDGETTLGLNIEKNFEFFAWASQRTEQVSVFHSAIIDLINARAGDGKFAPSAPVDEDYKGVAIRRDRVKSNASGLAGMAAVLVVNNYLQKSSAAFGGHFAMGMGVDGLKVVKSAIDRAQNPELVSADLRNAMGTPAPGTVVGLWMKPIEVLRPIFGQILPKEVPASEILGGLEDAPLTGSLRLHEGSIRLRATISGVTVSSGARAYTRLRHSGINPLKLFSGEEQLEPNGLKK